MTPKELEYARLAARHAFFRSYLRRYEIRTDESRNQLERYSSAKFPAASFSIITTASGSGTFNEYPLSSRKVAAVVNETL